MAHRNFYDIDHAAHQLQNSLVRYDEHPVWVDEVTSGPAFDMCAKVLYTDTGKMGKYSLKDSKWDFLPVKLGFTPADADLNRDSEYVVRMPARMWKIGLASGNCAAVMNRDLSGHIMTVALRTEEIMSSVIAKLVTNTFPTFEFARDFSKTEKLLTAFHKKWAIDGDYVFYRWLPEPVGKINGSNIDLYNHYQYLQQVMEEDLK